MREITFRAWKPLKKQMLYAVETVDEDMYFLKDSNGKEQEHLWQSFNRVLYEATWNEVQLMQFTGLRDSKDKPIYEGDILKCTYHGGVVAYGKCSLYEFNAHGFYVECFQTKEKELLVHSNECTIIGNIYENPELLQPSL